MTAPAPRPALRRAPDAHIHPAAPHTPGGAAAPDPRPASAPDPHLAGTLIPIQGQPKLHRLTAPPRGTTSDSLRPGKPAQRARREPAASRKPRKEKQVELTVRVPKSLRKDLQAAAKSAKRTPDEIVTSLIRAWIDS